MQISSVGKAIGSNFKALLTPRSHALFEKLNQCSDFGMSRIECSVYSNSVNEEQTFLSLPDMEQTLQVILRELNELP